MRTEIKSETTGWDVVRWRREQLTHTGFPLALAAAIAEDARYDLHALIELVERGCRPDLAVRIFAPVGDESVA
jgi:hypothetical protein